MDSALGYMQCLIVESDRAFERFNFEKENETNKNTSPSQTGNNLQLIQFKV